MEDYRKIAIELGQTLINKAPETREDVERMLPELKESEDEKVRKEIIIYLKSVISNKKFGDEIIESWIDWLEKQGEQNPAWSNVDDEIPYPETLEKAIDLYYYSYGNGEGEFEHLSLERFRDIVHTFVNDYGQKPAWSEHDETCLIEALGCIKVAVKHTKNQSELCDCGMVEDWLKSLKDRVQPQPKQEWSEEDIDMIDWLIRCCEKEHEELCNDRYGHQDIVSDLKRDCRKKWNWLESLKNKAVPQSHWKPSEEQIAAVKEASCYSSVFSEKTIDNLISLSEQLKKLKG